MSGFERFDDLDDLDTLEGVRNVPGRQRRPAGNPSAGKKRPPNKPQQSVIDHKLAQLATEQEQFHFSYDASRHERVWIINSLGEFYDQQWLEDVLRLVKGGKEANVYQCLASPTVTGLDQPYIAAKVYRPRMFRNLKNDQMYRDGRVHLDGDGRLVKDHGMEHAMSKRTAYGQDLLHTSWIEHEALTMRILQEAGADVPALLASANNALLMSYIGGDETPAPTLNGVRLGQKEARPLFERVVHNIDLMLANRRVHADLSAYNILYWEGEITLIDFPQAIDPQVNRNAFAIFERDVRRVCEYFERQGVHSNPHRLAAEMWQRHGYRTAPEIHPALLDAEDERDRKLWQRQER